MEPKESERASERWMVALHDETVSRTFAQSKERVRKPSPHYRLNTR